MSISLCPVIAQNAVIQRTAIHTPGESRCNVRITTRSMEVLPKSRVSRHHTVGDHHIYGFTPQPAALMGTPIGQGEAGEAGPVGQVHAPIRMASVDYREQRAVNAT